MLAGSGGCSSKNLRGTFGFIAPLVSSPGKADFSGISQNPRNKSGANQRIHPRQRMLRCDPMIAVIRPVISTTTATQHTPFEKDL